MSKFISIVRARDYFPPVTIAIFGVSPVNYSESTLYYKSQLTLGERGGLVINASDSGSRGRGFEPHSGCVLEQGTFTPQKHW